jgi:glycosyltransferase involved in cell wall biosynthesis
MTRVAVVIPCFDDPLVLEAVDSVRSQDEPQELVVVDDGSTDPATLAVLERLAEDGVTVVRRENGGLAAARMTGVEATAAPYVFPLDADDHLEPGALRALADALDAEPAAAVAWGDVRVFGEFELTVETAKAFDPWLLTFVSGIPGTSMVRRSRLLEAGGWSFPRQYEDWDLWLTFAERGWSGVHVPAPMLRYRRHGQRMLGDAALIHDDLAREIRSRHEGLFRDRAALRRRSSAPWHVKAGFTLLAVLPLSEFARLRLAHLLSRPRDVLAMRRLRRPA